MRKILFQGQTKRNNPLLLITIAVLIVVTVFSSFTDYSNYIIYPLWGICILYIATYQGPLSRIEKTFVIVSFAFLALIFFYWILGISSMPVLGFLENFNWIMSGVVAVYAMKLFSSKDLTLVYNIMGLSLLLLLLLFISEGRVFIVSGDDYGAVEVAVAWYGSLFMLLSGLSLILFLNVNRIVPRIIAIVFLALTLFLNISILQRGTNVIMTLAELGLILIFLIKRKSVVITLSIFVAVFIVIAFSSDNMILIFDWLAQISPSERLSTRFNEISVAIAYESVDAAGGSFTSRADLMNNSWYTFTSSFGHVLLGAGEHAADNTIIGHHSFFTDTLARYGLLGGALVLIYFVKQFQIYMASLSKKTEWSLYMQCAIVFAFYVFRNYYGIVAYSLVNFVVLLFFPLTFQLIHYYKNK